MSTAPSSPPSTPSPFFPNATVLALIAFDLDVLLVIVFAITGRASHAEVLDIAGIWATAWPFLAGLALSWLATRAWRQPTGIVWPGIGLWVGTVSIGMLLRLATGTGAALPFIIVATLTVAAFLLGWRGIAALVRRSRAR